jgi:hypothetical protein
MNQQLKHTEATSFPTSTITNNRPLTAAATSTAKSFTSKFGRKKSSTQSNLLNVPSNHNSGHQSNHHNGHNQHYPLLTTTTTSTNQGSTSGVGAAVGGGGGQNGFFKQLQDSKWFEQLRSLIDVANLICERMDDGSSVMVALEDGWDLTAQVVGLAEVLMDPYYRTIEGFCVLVEREWLSLGHR